MARLNPQAKTDPLVQSLASHLTEAGWLVYTEMLLGAIDSAERTGRVDVLALKRTYAVRAIAYEVKKTRGDFLRDVGSGKYGRYFRRCHQVYFAVPRGLVKVAEVPGDAGLITLNPDRGWSVAKAAPVHDAEVTGEMLLACMFRGQEQEATVRQLKDRVVWEENAEIAGRAKNLGVQIARRLRDVDSEWKQIEEAHQAIDNFLGEKSVDFNWSLLRLKRYLASLKGMTQFPVARDIVGVAHFLVGGEVDSWRKDGCRKALEKALLLLQDGGEERL